MKTVYQMDDAGVYIGTAIADPSPLELGVWLMPRGCVDTAPPTLAQGQLARWMGKAWIIEDVPTLPEPDPEPVILTREAFCVALIGVGILTEAEAEEAALGAWPAKFEPALAGKALVQRLTVKNIWRETKTVARNAQLFLDLLAFYANVAGLDAKGAVQLGDTIFAVDVRA